MTKQVGIVLSGGGFKGAAHIGLIKALSDHNIPVHKVSGSSAGAIVGALFCAGHSPEYLLDFFKANAQLFNIKYMLHSKPGLFDSDLKGDVFKSCFSEDSFASLDLELNICVTDVLNGKTKFISSGQLIKALLASAAIPGVFTPVELNGVYYFDGGTMNNFPVEPLTGRCDLLLGSYVSVRKVMKPQEISSIRKVVHRAGNLALLSNSIHKFHQCDYVFYPPRLGEFETMDSKYIDEIYAIGYQYGMEKIAELKKLHLTEWAF
ncbi:MAG: hypothetical protein Tsb0034_09980 [Ekhidna sp.]